ncbi:MAG: glycoside hydrolase family 2 protein, partial [Candidatus Acidiferrales bacterium]
ADNLYWQSTSDDDLGGKKNDQQFAVNQTRWADYTALNNLPRTDVSVDAHAVGEGAEENGTIKITNHSAHVAFFMRAEITKGGDGEEVLPVTYDDNYITLFPSESRVIRAQFKASELAGSHPGLRLEGYNVPKKVSLDISSPAN